MTVNFTGFIVAVMYDMGNEIKLLDFNLIAVFAGDLTQHGHLKHNGFHGTIETYANSATNRLFLFFFSSCTALRVTM